MFCDELVNAIMMLYNGVCIEMSKMPLCTREASQHVAGCDPYAPEMPAKKPLPHGSGSAAPHYPPVTYEQTQQTQGGYGSQQQFQQHSSAGSGGGYGEKPSPSPYQKPPTLPPTYPPPHAEPSGTGWSYDDASDAEDPTYQSGQSSSDCSCENLFVCFKKVVTFFSVWFFVISSISSKKLSYHRHSAGWRSLRRLLILVPIERPVCDFLLVNNTSLHPKMCFDFLNRLGVAHECGGQTDGQTDRTDVSNIAAL